MKMKAAIITLFLSTQLFAEVEVCSRKAQVAFGIFSHMWIKTEKVSAGMGGQIYDGASIGDVMELPYITDVFVRDHSHEIAEKCVVKKGVDEDCINDELTIGKPLGKWRILNQCQIYVSRVIEKCTTPEQKKRNRAIRRYKTLLRDSQIHRDHNYFDRWEMEDLMKKYQFTKDELNE